LTHGETWGVNTRKGEIERGERGDSSLRWCRKKVLGVEEDCEMGRRSRELFWRRTHQCWTIVVLNTVVAISEICPPCIRLLFRIAATGDRQARCAWTFDRICNCGESRRSSAILCHTFDLLSDVLNSPKSMQYILPCR